MQLFCKERGFLSCECMRQCHRHYCQVSPERPWEYDCTSFRETHGEQLAELAACH